MTRLVALAGAIFTLLAFSQAATAASFTEEPVIPNLQQAIDFSWAPDGSVYVATKDGKILHYDLAPGSTRTNPVYAIGSPSTVDSFVGQLHLYTDLGLTSIAVDSDFASNHYLWALVDRGTAATQYTAVRRTAQLLRLTLNPSGDSVAATTVVLGTQNPRLPGHTGTAWNDYDPAGSCANPVESSVYSGGPFNPLTQIPDGDPATTADASYDCWPADATTHTVDQVTSLPDGTLMISNGDSTEYTTVDAASLRAQNLEVLSGKVLHINRDGTGVAGHPFCPADNDLTDTCTKIWARGVRNPFRFSVVPGTGPGTGSPLQLFLGDVGANDREAAYVMGAGDDAGWPCWEGSRWNTGFTQTASTAPKSRFGGPEFDPAKTGNTYSCDTVPPAFDNNFSDPSNPGVGPPTGGAVPLIRPVFEWRHYSNPVIGTGFGDAIMGGPILSSGRPTGNGIALPQSWDGSAFMEDYVQGWTLRVPAGSGAGGVDWPAASIVTTPMSFSSPDYDLLYDRATTAGDGSAPWYRLTMREAPDGSLWYARFAPYVAAQGGIWRIRGVGPQAQISVHDNGDGTETFSTPDIGGGATYGWDLNGDGVKNGSGDGTVSGNTTTIGDTVLAPGQYVRVFVTQGGATVSDQFQIACAVAAQPTITSPASNTIAADGQPVTATGYAVDPNNPSVHLASSQLDWTELTIHGNSHVHISGQGTGASFVATPVRDHGLESTTEIELHNTQCPGNSTSVILRPKQSTLHLRSNVPVSVALQLNDSQVNENTPDEFPIAAGVDTQVAVPATLVSGGIRWTFARWSDGTTLPARSFEMPQDGDATLAASYTRGDPTSAPDTVFPPPTLYPYGPAGPRGDSAATPVADVVPPVLTPIVATVPLAPVSSLPIGTIFTKSGRLNGDGVRAPKVALGAARSVGRTLQLRGKLSLVGQFPKGQHVQVALFTQGCRAWSPTAHKFAKLSSSCTAPPRWTDVTLTQTKHTQSFVLQLPGGPPAGKYILTVRSRRAKQTVGIATLLFSA